ncbi:unnamed protein product [Strongylus vulgaris]|uniref:Uncharacterized protein n=1 Tax=Strongylus vulgaris TaxID=40348 RepID=A0A3P7JF93_STRVU|nr:unnamed protein product [Strongylus vulgaris]
MAEGGTLYKVDHAEGGPKRELLARCIRISANTAMFITSRQLFLGFSLSFFLQGCLSITIEDVYRRLLEKERNVDNTFAFNLIRPIGSVGGELIWPRSYDSSNELTFDENGAAFPVHERPSLSRILRRSRISSLNGNTAYKDSITVSLDYFSTGLVIFPCLYILNDCNHLNRIKPK